MENRPRWTRRAGLAQRSDLFFMNEGPYFSASTFSSSAVWTSTTWFKNSTTTSALVEESTSKFCWRGQGTYHTRGWV